MKTVVTGVWTEKRETLRVRFDADLAEALRVHTQLLTWKNEAVDAAVAGGARVG